MEAGGLDGHDKYFAVFGKQKICQPFFDYRQSYLPCGCHCNDEAAESWQCLGTHLRASDTLDPSYPQPPLCVEMGFTWTFPRNQDATVKLKCELILIKF